MSHASGITPRVLLRRLLARRGILRFATFLTQDEGTLLPGGVEALSGFVLDERGSVHGFWLAWDPAANDYTLDPWYPVRDPLSFRDDPGYQRACRVLGLTR